MNRFFAHWLTTALALGATAWILPGVEVASLTALMVAALVLGFVNAVIKPVLLLLTLPITLVTLGLFYLVVNGLAFGLAAWLVPGFGVRSFGWAILGAFMVVGWLASRTAHRVESKPMQYLALGGFVIAEAIIFLPLLYVAMLTEPAIIESAAGVTLLGVGGLTAVAVITRKDFSFLRGMLVWGGMLALVAIAAGVLFGLHLGTWFSVAMIGFAGAAVLYDTSNVLHHYPEDRYVAAALELFASIALMFWYVLQLFLSRD